ncbi:ribonuclease H-like domain-containing protein [Tanacetum coccineum]
MTEQDSPPPTITAMKIPIIKKGEYDNWSMRMRQYNCHTDHNLWDIIFDGDLQEEAALAGEQSSPPAPKTAKQLTAKSNQERVKSILLFAIPDEYLLKFHNVPDAKSLWAAIKSRFGGNDKSKKMQRDVLKHQFENFTTIPNESLDKAYDRFQKLISQLEVHAAPVSKEDINQKFLRSLSCWSQIALIMRNKPDIDQTDIDDLYNNLRVYEDEMKRSSSSTSNSQNLAFLSSKITSTLTEVSADEVVCSFFAQQTTSPPLDNEDLQQIDQDDLEELDIRWQVAMLTVRVQRFIQKTGRNLDFKGKQPVTFDKSNVECYNCHRKGHFAKECKSGRNQGKRSYGDNGRRNATTNESSLQALNFDSEREKHSRARLEIQGYELALESLESRILGHEKNELAWGEKYEFQNYELKCREVKIDNLKMELEKVVKERDEFSKEDGYHVVPPPITGNFLTPRADISFAEKKSSLRAPMELDDEDDVSAVKTISPVKKLMRLKTTATTPIESNKPLVKDEDGEDVDVHVYRSMIAICVCARFQVTSKASHLNAIKRIFRYLKHQPKLGLWYPRDSPFELEAFSDSDYGGDSLERKSTTGGCQFLSRRFISWQCKKQTIVANSTTKAEYVAAANCCGQVL